MFPMFRRLYEWDAALGRWADRKIQDAVDDAVDLWLWTLIKVAIFAGLILWLVA
jgi:hypothetical protein